MYLQTRPLHGVPFLLRDNIITLDQMQGTAGSHALLGAKPAYESSVVRKLCEAGAIILGKAALTEWAIYRWDNSPTGWSSRGGQCTGPYLFSKYEGIRICNPAGKGNVAGLKATTGLVYRDGVIPASNRLNTLGPFTLLAAEEWESYSSREQMALTVSDFASSLAAYFQSLDTNPNNLESMQDLVAFTKATAEEDYPRHNITTFEIILDKEFYNSESFKEMEYLREYVCGAGGIEGALDREKIDVLVVPTAARTVTSVTFASMGGSPLIAVPLGFYRPDTPIVKDKNGDPITLAPGIP
ncbi:amidase signature domain-containing protein [Apiosordaria backusii]|uniref:Amidase signature domain-containing protein n=1 Tax=Apiosordaria backusii TaxID=314023 RepID=A0AA40BLS6_9PEZI|nr:amidase signature domain-containing protein [Apiosordaria backusii]